MAVLSALRRRYATPLAAATLAAGLCVAGPGLVPEADAHDVVLEATPGDGSTVAVFPRKIILEFSGVPKDNFNTIAVSNSDSGEVLFTAEPDRDKQFLSVTVPEDIDPGPGNYIVGFQITSSDGHATRGKTSFAVVSSADQVSPTSEGDAAADPDAGDNGATTTSPGLSLGAIVGLMALVAVCGGVIVTLKKRK